MLEWVLQDAYEFHRPERVGSEVCKIVQAVCQNHQGWEVKSARNIPSGAWPCVGVRPLPVAKLCGFLGLAFRGLLFVASLGFRQAEAPSVDFSISTPFLSQRLSSGLSTQTAEPGKLAW